MGDSSIEYPVGLPAAHEMIAGRVIASNSRAPRPQPFAEHRPPQAEGFFTVLVLDLEGDPKRQIVSLPSSNRSKAGDFSIEYPAGLPAAGESLRLRCGLAPPKGIEYAWI